MADQARRNRQYLELHRGRWRVSVAVPVARRKALGGTRLKEPLNTDSLEEANRLKWPIVHKFKHLIAGTVPVASLHDKAETYRRMREAAATEADHELVDHAIDMEVEALLGPPMGEGEDGDGQTYPLHDPAREAVAGRFVRIARGDVVLLDRDRPTYEAQLKVKPRTKADDVRAMKMLLDWCKAKGVEPSLQAFSTKANAVAFMDSLAAEEQAGTRTAITLNKYLRRLAAYWKWLEKRGEVPFNVWQGLTLKEPARTDDEKSRPFTADEVKALLTGSTTPEMHDLMRIGALSGARLDAIVCLRVQDVGEDGCFTFKAQKKEPGPRLCPIHPALQEIVQRRCADKQPGDPLFPEWPAAKNAAKSMRERSFKASNEFTTYRRSRGVDDREEGQRRSWVTFHSFRNWFVTESLKAGQSREAVALAVGHKLNGVTLGVYAHTPSLIGRAREAVDAIPVPAGFHQPEVKPKQRRRKQNR